MQHDDITMGNGIYSASYNNSDNNLDEEVGEDETQKQDLLIEQEVIQTSATQAPAETVAETAGADGPEETPECPIHDGFAVQYYCSQCCVPACERCTEVEHMGHVTVIISEAVTERRTSLTALLSKVRQMTPDVEKAINEVQGTRKQLEINTAATEVKITTLFDELASLVEERKRTALAELHQVSASKEDVLQEQSESLNRQLVSINRCSELALNTLQGANDVAMVTAETEMTEELNGIFSQQLTLQSQTNSLATFNTQGFDGLREMISSFGNVYNNTAIPHQTTVMGDPFSGCVVGKSTTVTVTTRDSNGDLVKTGFAPLSAYISTDKHEDRLVPIITDLHDGTYDITFVLQEDGVHYLSVFLFDQQIRGSPYKIRAANTAEASGSESLRPSRPSRALDVKENKRKCSSPSRSHGSCNRLANHIEDDLIMRVGVKGRNKGEFTNPQGLCCYDNKVIVADSSNQTVQVFAPSGECILKFGAPARGPGKIQRPTGVAVAHSGNYLVADYDKKVISVFNPDGKFISNIGAARLQGPKGVAVDSKDNIIVVDNKSSSVLVFHANGKLVNKFGCHGNWTEQLAGPHYAAVNGDGDVAVSDFHNHCVKVFDKKGQFKFSFGSNGEGNGQFNAPTGVAVDDKGNMLIADWGNSRIQVFDSSGSFLAHVNTAREPLNGPQGLAVASQGVVVVADSGNHCIKYFKYLQ